MYLPQPALSRVDLIGTFIKHNYTRYESEDKWRSTRSFLVLVCACNNPTGPPTSTALANQPQIRKDIREFKEKNKLDKVVLLWTANTERFAALEVGINDTKENLLASIARGEDEVRHYNRKEDNLPRIFPMWRVGRNNLFFPGLQSYLLFVWTA